MSDPLVALLSHIDQPADWDHPTRCVIIRGWCFDPRQGGIHGIRLRTADRSLHGVVGLPRPDVKAALAEVSDDNTGFEIRGTLPSGRQRIVIEVQGEDTAWSELFTKDITVSRPLLPLWLGGGDWTELMFFQMPAHMAHPPRTVRPDSFPPLRARHKLPQISIVTPSYQQAAYLEETMHSVLEQSIPVQYVVQDGGSTDGSVAIIKRHEARLHAWTSAPDSGQADAIARGFAATEGSPDDVMAWINSDDFYLPGALRFVADYFARHPEVDVVYGHRIVVDEKSREIARWFLPRHDATVMQLNDFIPQETLFWRRRIWDRVGGLDTSFQFAIDWDLLLRFETAKARIVRLPYFLACFRAHAAQKTSAVMHSTGQKEITRLRERTHGRPFPAHEIEHHPLLMRYLRRSAFIQFLWQCGIRAP